MGYWELLLPDVSLLFCYPTSHCVPPGPKTDSPPMKGYVVGVCVSSIVTSMCIGMGISSRLYLMRGG